MDDEIGIGADERQLSRRDAPPAARRNRRASRRRRGPARCRSRSRPLGSDARGRSPVARLRRLEQAQVALAGRYDGPARRRALSISASVTSPEVTTASKASGDDSRVSASAPRTGGFGRGALVMSATTPPRRDRRRARRRRRGRRAGHRAARPRRRTGCVIGVGDRRRGMETMRGDMGGRACGRAPSEVKALTRRLPPSRSGSSQSEPVPCPPPPASLSTIS